jgi:hypothetical protein
MDVAEDVGVAAEETAEGDAEAAGAPSTEHDAQQLRDLIVRAHPDTVPELLQGGSLAELLACLPAAQAAYARVAETAQSGGVEEVGNVPVAAGATLRSLAAQAEGLSPLAKIRVGLTRRG